jgi:hypothetical protein
MLQIGWFDISYLGGPVSFSILLPSKNIPKSFKSKPLLLLGDHHNCMNYSCDLDKIPRTKKNNKLIVHINTPLWFRLLDLYGTKNYPVQYYIESNFDTKLLTDSYYFREEVSKWLINSTTKSYMTYILRYHPACFSNKDSNNYSSCITKYIDYKFSDLRLSMDYMNLKDTHKAILKIESLKITNSLKNLDSDIKESIGGKSREKLRKNFERFNNQRKSQLPDTIGVKKNLNDDEIIDKVNENKINSLPYYENLLYTHLSSYEEIIEPKYSNFIETIDFKLIDIIKLFYEKKYNTCFDKIFNIKNSNVINNSKLYNVILKLGSLNTNKINDWCLNLFKEYFIFFCEKIRLFLIKDETNVLIESMIKNYNEDIKIINSYSLYLFKTSLKDYIYNIKEEKEHINIRSNYYKNELLYSKIYPNICSLIADIILAPFNDIYILFDSYLSEGPLTVYNAGNMHVSCLYDFLIFKKIYNTEGYLGWNYLKKKIDVHCIEFNDYINLDNIIYASKINNEQLDKKKLIILRRDILGEKVFLDLLKGKPQSKEDLLKNYYFQNFLKANYLDNKLINYTFEEIIKLLELENLDAFVPSEYIKNININ